MWDPFLDQLEDCRDPQMVAQCLLHKGMAVSGAPMGNVHIMNWKAGILEITAHTGFEEESLDLSAHVGADAGTICAQALRRHETVTIEDARTENLTASYRAILARAGVCAIQSTPLISSGGAMMGVLSTHFSQPLRLDITRLLVLRNSATLAANRLIALSIRGRSFREITAAALDLLCESRETIAIADQLLARDRYVWRTGMKNAPQSSSIF